MGEMDGMDTMDFMDAMDGVDVTIINCRSLGDKLENEIKK
jgi:hypothetical protein